MIRRGSGEWKRSPVSCPALPLAIGQPFKKDVTKWEFFEFVMRPRPIFITHCSSRRYVLLSHWIHSCHRRHVGASWNDSHALQVIGQIFICMSHGEEVKNVLPLTITKVVLKQTGNIDAHQWREMQSTLQPSLVYSSLPSPRFTDSWWNSIACHPSWRWTAHAASHSGRPSSLLTVELHHRVQHHPCTAEMDVTVISVVLEESTRMPCRQRMSELAPRPL
jgi:hypothetical protein